VKSRYFESDSYLIRAEKVIPLGSQTFSKSRTHYPSGISPLFIERAKGSNVWDLDGNKYIDLVSSLAAVTIGYGDREIKNAVQAQLRKGVSFSLPGKLEAEVAELICELVPSAEMVRFGKNGTDATSAAVRLSRAYTGHNEVLVCGYHGWQDWFIGSTSRNKGVPSSVSKLTKSFKYNDIDSFTELVNSSKDIACIVMEPMSNIYPNNNFLKLVRKVATEKGIILIFDETITGFRFSTGGAQELFGVLPDLSTFGKGIANGFPLSAVVGRRDIMMEMENIFFSGTFGGELLSLAAAKIVLNRHKTENLCGQLNSIGVEINNGVDKLIERHQLQEIISLSGHPTWKFLNWKQAGDYSPEEIKTYFLQEAFATGLLVLGTHNISLAHAGNQSEKILSKYEKVLNKIQKSLTNDQLKSKLMAKPLVPIFSVR
jgi:glutamate-1-semialdehyde aminotransferase